MIVSHHMRDVRPNFSGAYLKLTCAMEAVGTTSASKNIIACPMSSICGLLSDTRMNQVLSLYLFANDNNPCVLAFLERDEDLSRKKLTRIFQLMIFSDMIEDVKRSPPAEYPFVIGIARVL
jgi:hypothetical protein